MKRVPLVRIFVTFLFVLPVFAFADELPCNTIIAPENWFNPRSDLETTSIEDCGDPFGRSEGVESPYTLRINNESILEGGIAYIQDSGTRNYEVEGTPLRDRSNILFFLHDGDDYRYVDTQPVEPTEDDYRAFAQSYFPPEIDIEPYIAAMDTWDYPEEGFDEELFFDFYDDFYDRFAYKPPYLFPGTYTLVVQEYELMLSRRGFLEHIAQALIPTAYAADDDEYIFTLTFTLALESEKETLDPLLAEYLPILRMHEDEDYLPMNVEAFVAGSALWDDNGILPDELVIAYDSEDPITLDDLAAFDDSDDLYLAFSDPENSKSLNIANALSKYEELVDEDIAQTTVYVRKIEDSYEDSFGEEHEFIVLQYWYFYAMNDWAAKGGLNNHEGDWESVFVFLDKDSEEPKYVAFSAHHNDGDPEWNLMQYDSVRREWSDDEIERDGTNVMSYVALGSHANYPKAGEHETPTSVDITSQIGLELDATDFSIKSEMAESESGWIDYEGKWGADRVFVGDDGPQGPYFIDVSGHLRYHNPLEWAGIDKIEEMVTKEPTTSFSFPGTGIKLNFDALIPEGTFFSIAPYFESPKGIAPSGTQLLSPFWDIESDLENEMFSTQVRLPIDHESLGDIDDTSNLNAYWFNPDTEEWEKQESAVDETGNFVMFNTNHFSRYTIGIEIPPETPVVEEGEIETETRSSNSTGTRIENRGVVPQVKGAQTSAQTDAEIAAYETLITLLQQVIVIYKEQEPFTQAEIQIFIAQIKDVLKHLESVYAD